MEDLYSEEVLKSLINSSKQMLSMCKAKDMNVCLVLIEALKRLKKQYPAFAKKADEMIYFTNEVYEIMDSCFCTNRSYDKYFYNIEYNIQESYGSLFKIIVMVNPQLQKYLKL